MDISALISLTLLVGVRVYGPATLSTNVAVIRMFLGCGAVHLSDSKV